MGEMMSIILFPTSSPILPGFLWVSSKVTSMKMLWKVQSTIQKQRSIIINIVVSLDGWRQGTGWEPNSWKAGDLNTKEGNFLCSFFLEWHFLWNRPGTGILWNAGVKGVGKVEHSAAKRHKRNTSSGSSVPLWSNKGCNGRGRQVGSAGLGFKARCVLDPPTGSSTNHQAILGARMSWHSVIDTEFSCQQPKNHPFYMACKENIDLEKTLEMV